MSLDTSLPSSQKKTAALVLSGGGGLGLAHVGALQVLEQHYTFDSYFGVSAGAIVSAAHAVGYSAAEISDIIHDQNFFALAFDFSGSNFGILRGQKVYALLEDIFKGKTFEDLRSEGKNIVLFATDFSTGERVAIRSGLLADAVMASLSVPVVFEPFQKNGKWLVDGGLSGNFPMEEAMDEYTRKHIVGIDVATSLNAEKDFSQKKFFGKPAGIQDTLERTFRIFFKTQQRFNPDDERLQIFVPDLSGFKTIDLLKLKEIEKAGRDCVSSSL